MKKQQKLIIGIIIFFIMTFIFIMFFINKSSNENGELPSLFGNLNILKFLFKNIESNIYSDKGNNYGLNHECSHLMSNECKICLQCNSNTKKCEYIPEGYGDVGRCDDNYENGIETLTTYHYCIKGKCREISCEKDEDCPSSKFSKKYCWQSAPNKEGLFSYEIRQDEKYSECKNKKCIKKIKTIKIKSCSGNKPACVVGEEKNVECVQCFEGSDCGKDEIIKHCSDSPDIIIPGTKYVLAEYITNSCNSENKCNPAKREIKKIKECILGNVCIKDLIKGIDCYDKKDIS